MKWGAYSLDLYGILHSVARIAGYVLFRIEVRYQGDIMTVVRLSGSWLSMLILTGYSGYFLHIKRYRSLLELLL